jgi:hypothetical protein
MSSRLFLFAAWCLFVFSGSVGSAYYGWSPFSDEDAGGGVGGVRGPTHK